MKSKKIKKPIIPLTELIKESENPLNNFPVTNPDFLAEPIEYRGLHQGIKVRLKAIRVLIKELHYSIKLANELDEKLNKISGKSKIIVVDKKRNNDKRNFR